jgi:hypothetical protein
MKQCGAGALARVRAAAELTADAKPLAVMLKYLPSLQCRAALNHRTFVSPSIPEARLPIAFG